MSTESRASGRNAAEATQVGGRAWSRRRRPAARPVPVDGVISLDRRRWRALQRFLDRLLVSLIQRGAQLGELFLALALFFFAGQRFGRRAVPPIRLLLSIQG